jgi:WXXGXW repeat (2 copies)
MKKSLLALMFLAASSSLFAAHVAVGIGVGVGPAYGYYAAPPPPPPAAAYYPPSPGPGFSFVPGYYYPVGSRFVWRAGYWARPPYAGAAWVGPRYVGHRYFNGYWRRR